MDTDEPYDMADTVARVLRAHGLVLVRVDPEATHQELIVCAKAPGPYTQGAVMREGFDAWADSTARTAGKLGSPSRVWIRTVWAGHWQPWQTTGGGQQ